MERKRILVVDDEDPMRRLYARYLTPIAHFDIAINGQEAMQLLLENPKYDLVITDDNMPIKSGIELLTAIKEYECIKLMVSSPINVSYRSLHETVQRLGGLGIYQKPIRSELFNTIVPELLTQGRSETLERYFAEEIRKERVVDF